MAVVVALIVLAVVPSVAPPASADTLVEATVHDSAGHPIAGWDVFVSRIAFPNVTRVASTTTDALGHFSVSAPGLGDLGLELEGPVGPSGIRSTVAVGPIATEIPAEIVVPVVAARFVVTDSHGTPVVGATITSATIPSDQGTVSLPVIIPGATFTLGRQVPQTVTTDATGSGVLYLLHGAPSTATVVVSAPTGSSLQPSTTLTDISLGADSTRNVALAAVPTALVTGVARDAGGALLGGWPVAFTTGTDTSLAITTTTAPDGSYSATVPMTADTVTLTNPLPVWLHPAQQVVSSGLVLTGPRTLDLTMPTVTSTITVVDPAGAPVPGASITPNDVGSPTSLVSTGPLFPGATTSRGWQSSQAAMNPQTDQAGQVILRRLKTTDVSPDVVAGPPAGAGNRWQYSGGAVSLATDTSTTITFLPLPVVLPGTATAMAPLSGTERVQVPLTLSAPSLFSNVIVSWHTIHVDGGPGNQAPPGDYRPTGGVVVFGPGQTSMTMSVDVVRNSTGQPEYVPIQLSSVLNANVGGFWGLSFLTIDPAPVIVPGSASVTAPTSGSEVLDVPVTLTIPSADTVTAQWTTRLVVGAPGNQAPTTDYVIASGTVTFLPGQTTASVPITVTGNSTGASEYVVVSFSGPTNALMGGFWGLGFGLIDPP